MKQVFISYAREDAEAANKLYNQLKWLIKDIEPWFDKKCLSGGDNWPTAIEEAIRGSTFFLFLLSKNSTTKTGYVRKELKEALEKLKLYPENRKFIIPIRLEECKVPRGLGDLQYINFFSDWNEGFLELVEAIKSKINIQSIKLSLRIWEGLSHSKQPESEIIFGKFERTDFIIKKLKKLKELINKDKDCKLRIYNQATFSSLSFSDDPKWKQGESNFDDYIKLLIEEQKLLNTLIQQDRTTFKMLLCPIISLDYDFLSVRYATLLEWMKQNLTNKRVHYLCTRHGGPNRLIISDVFYIEGYKLYDTSTGYEINRVEYNLQKVKEAEEEFLQEYNEVSALGKKSKDARRFIGKMLKIIQELKKLDL